MIRIEAKAEDDDNDYEWVNWKPIDGLDRKGEVLEL
jgi:hypothetical protein